MRDDVKNVLIVCITIVLVVAIIATGILLDRRWMKVKVLTTDVRTDRPVEIFYDGQVYRRATVFE